MKPSYWIRYISFDFQTMSLLQIEHSSSFTAKTDKPSRIPNPLAPGSMIETQAVCKALPLLGVLICPWVSSPCVTRVFRKRLFLTECIESLTIVVKSLFTQCGKSFFTKCGESLLTQCGGSRHNFELLCRSSLELFDLWRKMEWKQQTQDCMLLSRNAKTSCYEKWSWALNHHNCWSCYGVLDRDQFQHLDGEASGICRSWLSPMVDPLRLLEVVNISLVPSNNSSSLFNPTFNSLSSSFCSSQRSFASWLFVDISILTKM